MTIWSFLQWVLDDFWRWVAVMGLLAGVAACLTSTRGLFYYRSGR